ncbi:FtsW/RodA/SpoVE family cell cycle protein [Bacillus alkalicellulosilyticus]|uniref:FtsW/RodA/SpoVE family cell cycle protein n=1 Tax=Alkalihalobacterium alkalicellulosilyticum TaxID=1912214 RepID=UPI0009964212|nr:FtsW/RodA/SpoVE family cell cycle protein [Bacillus alkalicellulosilyticus]
MNTIQKYIEEVCRHIKSKEARKVVSLELEHHLAEKKSALQEKGITGDEADAVAVEQMGNPITVGKEFHKLHKPIIDWGLLSLLVILLGVSLLPKFVFEQMYTGSFLKTLIFSLVGLGISLLIMFFNYRWLANKGLILYGIAIALLFWSAQFGVIHKGRPMLSIFNFKTDYFILVLILGIAWASILSTYAKPIDTSWKLQILVLVAIFIPVVMFSSNTYPFYGALYFILTLILLWNSPLEKKVKRRFMGTQAIVAISVTIVSLLAFIQAIKYTDYTLLKPHHLERINGFLFAEQYKDGAGYQNFIIKDLLGNSSWFGTGEQPEQLSKLPEIHTDFVLTSLIHSIGWFGASIIILIFIVAMIRIGTVFMKTAEPFGRLIVIGGLTIFSLCTLWSLGMNIGVLPITNVSFPFLSYGGMNQMIYSVIFGLILSVYRRRFLVAPTVVSKKI